MKLHFTTEQSTWLHNMVRNLMSITKSSDDMNRVASKMRYKFHGAPATVFLTGKERALIHEVASYRFASLETQPTEERDVVKSIVKTLEGGT